VSPRHSQNTAMRDSGNMPPRTNAYATRFVSRVGNQTTSGTGGQSLEWLGQANLCGGGPRTRRSVRKHHTYMRGGSEICALFGLSERAAMTFNIPSHVCVALFIVLVVYETLQQLSDGMTHPACLGQDLFLREALPTRTSGRRQTAIVCWEVSKVSILS
jgi:hypothetical protein